MPAVYEPPYESPIEDLFALNIVKYLADDVVLTPQVEVNTICGRFVLDFVLWSPMVGRVGIECDGKEFHDGHRDEWRDAMILGGGLVDSIYRLRGSDIVYRLEDILYLIGINEDRIMSERGMMNLRCVASVEVKASEAHPAQERLHVVYEESAESSHHLLLEARRGAVPYGQRRFWQTAYDFALMGGGGELDALISRYSEAKSCNV